MHQNKSEKLDDLSRETNDHDNDGSNSNENLKSKRNARKFIIKKQNFFFFMRYNSVFLFDSGSLIPVKITDSRHSTSECDKNSEQISKQSHDLSSDDIDWDTIEKNLGK